MKLFLVLFILLSSSVYAVENCSSVSIDTKFMPKNNNQANLDWCFAWTSIDLLSFYEQEQLSAYDFAIQYLYKLSKYSDSDEIKNFTDVGGDVSQALVLALKGKKGLCLEKDTDYANGDWEKVSTMLVELGNPDKKMSKVICEQSYQSSEPFKDITSAVVKILDQLSSNRKLSALMDVSCLQRYKFKNKYGVGSVKGENASPEYMMKKLDALLTSKNPVSIDYDSNLISNGPDYKKQVVDHSSTIIGRRLNPETKQCEYQLKNSWGDGCPRKEIFECSEGNYWIPANTLKNNIQNINWLLKR